MRSLAHPRHRAADGKSADPRRRPIGPRPPQVPRLLSGSAVGRRDASAPPLNPVARAPAGLTDGLQTVMDAMRGFSLANVVIHRKAAGPAPQVGGQLPINDDAALEREADALGKAALELPNGLGTIGGGPASNPAAPCHCAAPGCSSCGSGPIVLRKAEGAARPSAAPGNGFGGRAGRPLDPGARQFFEPRFGTDFGAVRIHDDPATHEFARGIGAQAFAMGSDIGFASGRWSPGTSSGRALLAHELAHVALGHGDMRRKAEGDGKPATTAKPLPKQTVPTKPSGPSFSFQGVTIADDPEFMRGELRRLIANRGLEGADDLIEDLEEGGGRPVEPGLAEQVATYLLVPPILRPKPETKAEEQARLTAAPKAVPTALRVFKEVRKEAVAFLITFEGTAIGVARAALAQSWTRTKAEQLRYGLERTKAGDRMKNEPSGMGLAGAAKDLLAKRDEVHKFEVQKAELYKFGKQGADYESYLPAYSQDEYDRLDKASQPKELELAILEGVYYERYPILARVGADRDSLKKIAQGPSAGAAEALNDAIADTLENIVEVRSELKPGGKIKTWKLPDIVALAKAASGCNEPNSIGRMRSKLVDEKVLDVESDEKWRDRAMAAVAIGLGILAAIPTGGTSVAAGVAVAAAAGGSFALSAVQAGQQLQQYMIEKAMAGTDLDRARAIGHSDPSLLWLAIDILGALADLGPAVKGGRALLERGRKAFQSLADPARKAVGTGSNAADLAKLEKAAEGAGITGLAKRVLGSAKKFGKQGASVEKQFGNAAGHEAAAVAKGDKLLKEGAEHGLGKVQTDLGGHTIAVTPQGWLVRCSHCAILRAEYAEELATFHALAVRMQALEVRGAEVRRLLLSGDKAGAKKLAQTLASEGRDLSDVLTAIRGNKAAKLTANVTGKRGMTFVTESAGKPSSDAAARAQQWEAGVSGAMSAADTKKRMVPALFFDKLTARGRDYVKFDGYEVLPNGDILMIDRKTDIVIWGSKGKGIDLPPKVENQLRRQSAAIADNPGYKGMIEVPTEMAKNRVKSMLLMLDIRNIDVRVGSSL